MLSAIANRLGALVRTTWETEIQTWGEKVRLYRQYAEGAHRAKLTSEMREMLRISDNVLDQFNLNYCAMVVDAMTDRLKVVSISAEQEAAAQWSDELLRLNRFDGLQMDIHDAALRDGVTFIMVGYDNTRQTSVFALELAWDGDIGLIPVYDRMNKNIVAAVKVWYEGPGDSDKRINIYYPDRVEKFTSGATGSDLQPYEAEPGVEWLDRSNQGVGVPIIAFSNRSKANNWQGISEVAGVIPAQDALNRTLVSMVMTGELTAFQLRYAIGFAPPAKVTPGMWVVAGENGVTKDQVVQMGVLEQGQLVPFISQAQFLIDQIGTISRTPLPGFMGGDASSGEALKQREVGLISKVERFQVKGGNSWEDTIALAARVQAAFGTRGAPPAETRWSTEWEEAELRNDEALIALAKEVRPVVGDAEYLRIVGVLLDYDESDIQRVLAERQQQTTRNLSALGGGMGVPGFGEFGRGLGASALDGGVVQ